MLQKHIDEVQKKAKQKRKQKQKNKNMHMQDHELKLESTKVEMARASTFAARPAWR